MPTGGPAASRSRIARAEGGADSSVRRSFAGSAQTAAERGSSSAADGGRGGRVRAGGGQGQDGLGGGAAALRVPGEPGGVQDQEGELVQPVERPGHGDP
ncbi:hypothetical protein B0E53_01085 [Micromonospora sp. MH33]|nr:hypothetical protein B0E53_01085 [Micromonospora sp. MH33]